MLDRLDTGLAPGTVLTREWKGVPETVRRIALLAQPYIPASAAKLLDLVAGEDRSRPLSDQEIVELSWAVAQINAWNRMAVGMRAPVAEKDIA